MAELRTDSEEMKLMTELRASGEAMCDARDKRDRDSVVMPIDEELVFDAICRMDEAADTIARLVAERDALANVHARQLDEDSASIAQLRASLAQMREALKQIVDDYDACSGAEPSLSVLHRSIDVDGRAALQSEGAKP